MAVEIIGFFGPKGDAGFGFGLGMIPSFLATVGTYFALSIWLISSICRQFLLSLPNLKFYVLRFIVFGGILSASMAVNAILVFRKYYVR